MKRYTVAIGDKTYVIGLQQQESEDHFRVLAGGKVYDLRIVGQEETDMEIPAMEVVEARKEKPAIVHKPPELLPRARKSEPPEMPASPAPEEEVPTELHAPMPGVIIEVSIPPGARVSRGDQLFVLEAMKMKNPIRSPRDGVVDTIYVREGQSVNFDDLLLSYREG
jgi:biotin carboxyl carrier protein